MREIPTDISPQLYVVPNPEVLPASPFLLRPTTENPRRIAALHQAFPFVEIQPIPGGVEDESKQEFEIAKDKLYQGKYMAMENRLWHMAEANPAKRNTKTIYIAGDIRTAGLRVNEHGVADTQSSAKPTTLEEVRAMFENMVDAHTDPSQIHTTPYYDIRAGSGMLIEEGRNDPSLYVTYHTTSVMLDSNLVERLSTPEGFERYVDVCNHFHTSDLYREVHDLPADGKKPLMGIAGGLELAALARLGVVTQIDDTKANDPRFRRKLQDALYAALVGISPKMLNQIDPHASARLENWRWMQNVTEYGMQGIELMEHRRTFTAA